MFYESHLISEKVIKDKHTNKYNIYIKGRYNTEIYRYDKNTLAIYFTSNQTINSIANKLNEKNIKLSLLVQGDTESIYTVKESHINDLHEILHFKIVGKNDQLKEFKVNNKILIK